MRVFVTGATGFLGHALVMQLQGQGHEVTVMSRSPRRARERLGAAPRVLPPSWHPAVLASHLSEHAVAVHLAGAPVLGPRWNRRAREELRASHVQTTRALVQAAARAPTPPRALVVASSTDFYGDRGDHELREESPAGEGFLAELWQETEAAAAGAPSDLRVALLRFGFILAKHGGVLRTLLRPFRAGLGARLGTGLQYMPWIHLDDAVNVVIQAVCDERFRGAINATSPAPADNNSFAKLLAKNLGKDTHIALPSAALRLRFGAGANTLLHSKRAVPQRLQELGFRFRYSDLAAALLEICASDSAVRFDRWGDRVLPTSSYLSNRKVRYELSQKTYIEAPLEEVFAFFSQAENLGAITPPDMSFSIRTSTPLSMEEGQVIDYTIRLGRLPLRWRTCIEAWDPDKRFVDIQLRGPYHTWWHEHRFRAQGSGTVMEDRVLYAPPLGVLGVAIHGLLIRRALLGIFSYRSEIIQRRFGQSPTHRREAA